MSNHQLMTTAEQAAETLAQVAKTAQEFAANSRASNTIRAYRADWQHFVTWCDGQGLQSLPASNQTVALYLSALAASHKASTLSRRLQSISQAHRAAGFTPISTRQEPLHSVWMGIRRTIGTAQHGKAPVVTKDIRVMVSHLPENLLGMRDNALLLVGFAGAFRRSELVALDVADLEFTREGVTITVRRSKTDQTGEGAKKGIPYGVNPSTCPVRALRDWLRVAEITEGPVFRSVNRHGRLQPGRLCDKAVAYAIKRVAKSAGMDPSKYAGHSLRAGLATAAAQAGASERAIMNQTGHKSVNMVRRYIREGNLYRENAAAFVGL